LDLWALVERLREDLDSLERPLRLVVDDSQARHHDSGRLSAQSRRWRPPAA
jgi:hypothetical protein